MVEEYIKKFMEKVLQYLNGIIFMLAYFNYMNSPDAFCDEKSSFYSYAHSLSQERLGKIYLDLKSFAEQKKYFKRMSRKLTVKPKEFEDLEYMRLIVTERSLKEDYATIRLSACMDSTINIVAEGLLSEKPIVKLIWGEFYDREEILWEK